MKTPKKTTHMTRRLLGAGLTTRRVEGAPGGPRRALARALLDGLARSGRGDTTLQAFLTVAEHEDAAAAAAIRAALREAGVVPAAPPAEGAALQVNPEALRVVEDVIAGLREAPEAEESGVRAEELSAEHRQHLGLQRVARVLTWAGEKVLTGKQVLEAWQAAAQGEIAGALLLALAGAKDEAEWIAIVADAAEVLQLEERRLQDERTLREEGRAERQETGEQLAADQKEVRLLQTLGDLRARRPVDRATLEEMAAYYAARGGGEATAKATPRRNLPRA